jgi:hypothetical protein
MPGWPVRVFVSGLSTNRDSATVAYRAGTGATLWARRYDSPAGGLDSSVSLGVAPDGHGAFITGTSNRFGHFNKYVTVGYGT